MTGTPTVVEMEVALPDGSKLEVKVSSDLYSSRRTYSFRRRFRCLPGRCLGALFERATNRQFGPLGLNTRFTYKQIIGCKQRVAEVEHR